MRPWNNAEVLAFGSRVYSIIQQENNYVVRHHPAHHIGAAAHRSDTKLALQHGVGLLPSSGIGVILIIVLILVLMGRL